MILPPVRVVAIDNEEQELQQVVEGLHRAGIPCLPFLYDIMQGLISAPPQPYSSVRLIFLDLNLINLGGDPAPKNLYKPISEVLSSLVAGGPYILIFWSSYASKVDEVMELVRDRTPETPVPVTYSVMEKQDLLLPDKKNRVAYDAALERLKTTIEAKILLSNCLNSLRMWEARLSDAGSVAASNLFTMASDEAKWNYEETEERLSALCGIIAKEAAGKNAGDNPAKAVESGLLPLIVDQMGTRSIENDYRKAWDAALPANLKKLDHPAWLEKSVLNACYLVEECNPSKSHRGAWIPFSEVIADNEAMLKCRFGKGNVQIFEEFLSFQGHSQNKAQKNEHRSACRLGLVEISAECDFAQAKERLYRYALSVMIPFDLEKYTLFFDVDKKQRDKKNEAVFRLPPTRIAGKDYILEIHCNYVLGLNDNDPILGNPTFRLRSQVLNSFLFYYARHTSRPGIISFE